MNFANHPPPETLTEFDRELTLSSRFRSRCNCMNGLLGFGNSCWICPATS